jgi:glycerophosphoryl diester phosphodiesterase
MAPFIAAHRGASDNLPENTIVAIAAAVDLGCEYVEFDVRSTRDQRLVLLHDERLERTTDGAGRVSEITLHKLRDLDAGGWLDDTHRGRKVPTLNEILAVVRGTARFIVDFKESTPELVQELALSLRADDVLDKAIVTSPHAAALETLAAVYPDVPLAAPYKLVFSGTEPVALARIKPRLIHARAADATPEAAAAVHAAGLKLLATIPRELDPAATRALASRLEAAGADGVMTARARMFLQTGLKTL